LLVLLLYARLVYWFTVCPAAARKLKRAKTVEYTGISTVQSKMFSSLEKLNINFHPGNQVRSSDFSMSETKTIITEILWYFVPLKKPEKP